MQSLHGLDRYSNRDRFTNSNWLASAYRLNANLGRFIGSGGEKFSLRKPDSRTIWGVGKMMADAASLWNHTVRLAFSFPLFFR